MTQIDEAIQKARAKLAYKDPFFATIAYNLELVKGGTDTIATDGRNLFYNLAFIEGIKDPEQVIGVMCHEMLHIVFRHHTRRGNRNPIKWNIAGDIVINMALKDMGYKIHPSSITEHMDLTPFRTKEGVPMLTEEVYNLLPQMPCPDCGKEWEQHGQPSDDEGSDGSGDAKQDKDGKSKQGKGHKHSKDGGYCGHGHCVKDAGRSKEDLDKADQEAEVLTDQAAQVSKMAGKLPAGLERLLDRIRQTKLDYRSILPEFVQASIKYDDVDWLRPNRRLFSAGMYVPRIYNPSVGRIDIALDTSGSISGPILEQFLGEIHGVMEQMNPSSIRIYDTDAEVHSIKDCKREDFPLYNYHPKGGGGTAFAPFFEAVEKQEEPPTCAIYLTDLYGSFPDKAPDYPVLWVVYGGCEEKPPFGMVAYIKE